MTYEELRNDMNRIFGMHVPDIWLKQIIDYVWNKFEIFRLTKEE